MTILTVDSWGGHICFIYTIDSSQIKVLKIDKEHICHISGKDNISQPEWAGTSGKREDVEAIHTGKFQ